MKDDADVQKTTQSLAQKYGFTPVYVYDAVIGGFAAPDLTREVVAQIRCEPAVNSMEYNSEVYLY